MKKFAMFLSVLLIAVTLAAPVSAAVNFNPSVEQKPAPTVDTVTDANGNEVSAIIRDQDGNESSAGAIFTESAYNSTTMEDPVTVAYGHQMHAGTMFGKLQETYSQENALEDYGEVIVYLPEKELHYQVFAAVPYDNRHILYNYDCTDSRRFNAFLNSIYEVREIGAQFNSGVTVSTGDKVLVLSTCLAGNSQRRYLVLAVCQAEID